MARLVGPGLIVATLLAAAPVRAHMASLGAATRCAEADRARADVDAWRKEVLKAAGDRQALAHVLARLGFELATFKCLGEGTVKAVDVFPATFGRARGADRIVQVRTRGCVLDRDFVVLTRSADGSYCIARGEVDKGLSINGCAYDPPILSLVHLTDASRQTLRIDASHGENATTDRGDKECYRSRLVQFWDVEPGGLVFRLEVPAGPITLSGDYPKKVQALDDMGKLKIYLFDGSVYRVAADANVPKQP